MLDYIRKYIRHIFGLDLQEEVQELGLGALVKEDEKRLEFNLDDLRGEDKEVIDNNKRYGL